MEWYTLRDERQQRHQLEVTRMEREKEREKRNSDSPAKWENVNFIADLKRV